MSKSAVTTAELHPIIAERWSPRGFDADAVRAAFDLDERLQPLVVVAIGVADPAAPLTEELAARERAERSRKPLAELLLPNEVALRRSA